jgi:Uma2 family endonuclease
MQAAWPMTHLSVPVHNTSLKLVLDPDHLFDDKAYFAFCRVNPDLRVERNAEGEILIVPPAGSESSYRNLKVSARLDTWAEQDGRGTAFESSAQFMLPDGSALSPDAAWVSNVSLRRLSRQKRKEFLPLCPEFVAEVLSPSDRLKDAKAKMEQWIANGAHLAWLIDGDAETVYVYRKNHAMKMHRGIGELAGQGPVEGFVLKLGAIWKGLG